MIQKQYKIGQVKLKELDFLWVCKLAYDSKTSLEDTIKGLLRSIEMRL